MELDLRLASSAYTSIISYTLSPKAHQDLLDGLNNDLREANKAAAPPGAAPPLAPAHLPQSFSMAGLFDIQGHSEILFFITVLPFALMGLGAIFLSFFPDASDTGRRVRRVQLAVRHFLARPLPPFGFWKRWTHGLCIGEVLLFTWAFAPQLWYTIASFNYSRWVWDSGHATHVYQLTDFNQAQFWLRWTAMQGAIWFLSKTPFIFIPVCRGSLITSFLGVGYDKAIKFHRWMGYHLVAAMFLHGFLLQVLFVTGSVYWVMMTQWKYIEGASNLAGVVAWVACVVLAVGTQIRRINYWMFYHSHVASAMIIIVFLALHINFVGCFAFGFVVWGIDVVYRLVQISHAVDLSATTGKSGKVVTLLIPIEDGVKYEDGSHVWINVPRVSWVQFHPFTVASSRSDPHDDGFIRLHIKVFNRWTKRLAQLAATSEQLKARIQGPFDGHHLSTEEQARLSEMVFFVGGVGMTAVSGTIHSCAVQRAEQRTRHGAHDALLPPVKVVYAFSDPDELSTVLPLLPYAPDINLTLHYTGRTPLPASVAIAKPTASPPSKAPVGPWLGKAAVPVDGGLAPAADEATTATVARALVPRVASRWQLLLVWLVAALVCLWIIALPDAQILQSKTILVRFKGSDVQYYPLWTTVILLTAAFGVTAAVIVPIHVAVRCCVRRRPAAPARELPWPSAPERSYTDGKLAADPACKASERSEAADEDTVGGIRHGSIQQFPSTQFASSRLSLRLTSLPRALGRSVGVGRELASASSLLAFNSAYDDTMASSALAAAQDGPLSERTLELGAPGMDTSGSAAPSARDESGANGRSQDELSRAVSRELGQMTRVQSEGALQPAAVPKPVLPQSVHVTLDQLATDGDDDSEDHLCLPVMPCRDVAAKASSVDGQAINSAVERLYSADSFPLVPPARPLPMSRSCVSVVELEDAGDSGTSAQSHSSRDTSTSNLVCAANLGGGSSPQDGARRASEDLDPLQLYVHSSRRLSGANLRYVHPAPQMLQFSGSVDPLELLVHSLRRESDPKMVFESAFAAPHIALPMPAAKGGETALRGRDPPPHLHAFPEALITKTADVVLLSLPGTGIEVPINKGRPDLLGWLEELRPSGGRAKPLGVWTAGHPAMCATVYRAVFARKWGYGVELHESTFEL